jgi:hypothetical protein
LDLVRKLRAPPRTNSSSSSKECFVIFANLRRQICPVPPKSQKGLSSLKINERSIGKEFKLYNNHFPKLRDEGMLATMPFKGGIQPFGTKEGGVFGLSVLTKAFSVLPLVSHLSQTYSSSANRSSL